MIMDLIPILFFSLALRTVLWGPFTLETFTLTITGFAITSLFSAFIGNGRISYAFWWCVLAFWLTTASWLRRRRPVRYPLRAHAFRRDRYRHPGWREDECYYEKQNFGGEP